MTKAARGHAVMARPSTRLWLPLILLIIFLYGVVPQLASFDDSLRAVRHAQPYAVLAAFGSIALSYIAATGVYVLLAKKPLNFGRTWLMQLVSTFANRLLPAGIGAIGTNYRYLTRNNHTPAQASAVVTVNNVLGFIGNLGLLGVILSFSSVRPQQTTHLHFSQSLWFGGVAGLAFVIVILVARQKSSLKRKLGEFLKTIRTYRRTPFRFIAALGCSIVLTICYTLCLRYCLAAIGVHLSWAIIFIVMTLGVAGATITPTPGGLGGAEAALVAALVVYDVNSSLALAAVLLYRLFTYWLPLVFGGVAFLYARRQQYI